MSREQRLDKELRLHLQQQVEEYVTSGMTRQEAERRARLDFGGLEQVKEDCRESRSTAFFGSLLRDLRYGLRTLRRNPGFTAVAVLSIALGIGANTAIFGVIQALLLRWLPVPNPQQLYQVNMTVKDHVTDSFSYPVIKALEQRKDVFASLGGFSGNSFIIGPADAPVRTSGAWASGGFFSALELQPEAGRLLDPADDQPGAPLVAVISDGYWERNYRRDPRAIGASIIVEGHPTTIVGVTPPGFVGAEVGSTADLTMPLQALAQLSPGGNASLDAGSRWNRVLARLAPGLSEDQARARLKVIWPPMAPVGVHPKAPAATREALLKSSLDLAPGGTGWTTLRNQYTKPLYVLLAISALVLLVACANVANLLLARSTARKREIAIRLAIGASRGRVIRQLLVESLLLASIGATLGLIFAEFGSRLLVTLVSGGPQPISLDAGINGPLLAFTSAVAICTGLLFGLAPAFRATASGPGEALKSNERTGASRGLLGPTLVSVQVALSLLLLIGAGLFVGTMRNLERIDPGFRHQGVLMLDVNARRAIPGEAQQAAFFRESLSAISQLRGVVSASFSNYTPVSGGYWSQSVNVDGQRMEGDHPFLAVSSGYFATLRIPLNIGRDFTLRDDAGAPPVAIVNEEFVRRFIPNGHPLGRHVSAAESDFYQNMEIVGVTANASPVSLREAARPCVFVPFFQQAPGRAAFGTFEILVNGSFTDVSAAALDIVRPRLPGLPLSTRTFTRQIENSFRRETLMAKLAGFFGVLGLVLAAVGLYGLLAYTVTRRTGEIGIRMALGAQRRQVLWMVLGGALRLVAIGVVLGLPAAWWASRLVSGMLYGLTATDPATIAVCVAVLAATALLAGFLPAHRASRVEPMAALRYE
jgi:putative ABC transport system permease protein